MTRVRLPVGRQRLHASISPTEARYTRAIRAQMNVIENNLKKVIDAIEDVTPEALRHAVQPIFDESQRLVPRDTGALAESGFVEVQSKRYGASVVIGYGKGGRPDYSVYVHERTDQYHKPPTQAKFLEEAAIRFGPQVPERYAAYVKNDLGL